LPEIVEFVASGGGYSQRKLTPLSSSKGRDRKGILYVLVDVEAGAGNDSGDEIRDTLADTFYHDSGSVTSSLLRAIRQINETLYEENERSIRSERQYATVVAAVVRDSDMYFAVVGSGRAYLIDEGSTERIGSSDDDEPAQRLGEADDVGIAMYHRGREHEPILILASGNLPSLLDNAIAQVPEIPPERALPLLQLFGEHARKPFRALAIVTGRSREDDAEAEPARIGTWERLNLPRPRLPSLRLGLPRPSATARLNESVDRTLGATPAPRSRPGAEDPRPGGNGNETHDVSRDPRVWGRRQAIPPPTFKDEEGEFEDEDDEEAGRFPRRRLSVPVGFVVGAAALALFVIGILVARFPLDFLRNGAAYASTVTRLAQAEQEEQTGLQQTDPLAKRQHLDNARRLALEAQTMGGDNQAVATAVARIQGEYQAATGTIALPAPVRLLDLPNPNDQMLVEGLEIYLLNRQSSEVDRYLLNADQSAVPSNSNPTLIRKGDHIGSATIGDLTAMAWIPAGGARDSDSLVVLDRSGFLVQYSSTRGLNTLALRDPTTWSHVTALGGYGGNLFALNPSTQTLAWYPPTSSGYDGDAYSYFAPTTKVDLTDATDFVAGNDLYLDHLSGQIQKFTAGKTISFPGPPVDLAPSHPAGLAVAAGSVYVGDPQRAEIVQLGTDGSYQRTLGGSQNAAILSNLRDLAVSDDGQLLFVLTDNAIYRFDLSKAH